MPETHRQPRDSCDGEWVINGSKTFITNAGTDISGCVTITAVTDQSNGRREISNILVAERDSGLRGRSDVPQDGLARLRHPTAQRSRTAECLNRTSSAGAAEASGSS